MIKVVVIGAGSVAWSLIKAIEASEELSLEGVVVRSPRSAEQIGCNKEVAIYTLREELPAADIYLLAVSDSSIEQVAGEVNIPCGAVVAHTAGSVDLAAVSHHVDHGAVLYPMQSFTKGKDVDWSEVPIFIEGATPHATQEVQRVAQALSEKVYPLTSQERKRLHIAAVFGCNFVNAMLGAAHNQLSQIGLPLTILSPLLDHTIDKAMESSHPSQVQTGPAVRGDESTQQSHLELIEREDEQEIYKLISSMIWKISKRS